MSILTFDVEAFRAEYPEFAPNPPYTDELLQFNWDTATCYISDENCGRLQGACRQTALNLMTAHLTKTADLANSGQTSSLVTSASVDTISVGLEAPPGSSQWRWWLNTTNYGQRLLALLQSSAIGGWMIGGAPEQSAFRKTGRYY